MKKIFKLLWALALMGVAVACDEPKEPEPVAEPVLSEITLVEVTSTTASLKVSVRNADTVNHLVVPSAHFEATGELNEFLATTSHNITKVDIERSEEDVEIAFSAEGLTPEMEYIALVWAENKDVQVAPGGLICQSLEFTTLAEEKPEPEPEPEPEPDENAVYMSDIEVTSVVAHSVEFSVTTRKMNDFGFVVVPTAEYTEMTAEEVIAQSAMYNWADGNLSWEQDFTFPFNHDTAELTDYTVVAAAVNDTSSVIKTATFSTPKAEMTVEKLSFKPTSLSVTHEGSDHYLVMTTALYEMCVHLQGGEEFGGRYDNNDDLEQGFVIEGTYFKKRNADDTWTVYDEVDPTIGNIDLYENVITGLWEIYGSFCFAIPDTDNGWLTIEIEIPSGTTLKGAERTEPVEFNLNITEATAVQDESSKSIWHLTLAQDKNNTLTFELKLDSSKYEYIPSGKYVNDGQGTPCLNGCSMILNNVSTSLGAYRLGESRVTVEYNATTGESYISAVAYVKAGTAVAKIAKCGPFKLYEEKTQDLEVVEESRNLMIWATWNSSQKAWLLDFMGDAFHGQLYFVTGGDNSDYLPEGRYTFAKSAPADGGLWLDCSESYVARLRSTEKMYFLTNVEGAYMDVTTEVDAGGNALHTIQGTIKTENGFYEIHFDYGVERGSIY